MPQLMRQTFPKTLEKNQGKTVKGGKRMLANDQIFLLFIKRLPQYCIIYWEGLLQQNRCFQSIGSAKTLPQASTTSLTISQNNFSFF